MLNGLNCNFLAQNKTFIERLAHTSDLAAATANPQFPSEREHLLPYDTGLITQAQSSAYFPPSRTNSEPGSFLWV